MKITERQKEILNSLVGEYISSAQPVSSQLLEKKYNFGICPATVRIEMQKLGEAGFIVQPHTSAGRVPTDKGYRFFVNDLLEKEIIDGDFDSLIESWFEPEIEDTVKFLQSLTKNLASLSSNLVLAYLADEKIFWKEGWEEVLQEPEFKEGRLISSFSQALKNFEENIGDLDIDSEIKVFIGKENPFPKAREFSTIISRCRFTDNEEGLLALFGPKRMGYEKNIHLLTSLEKVLENF